MQDDTDIRVHQLGKKYRLGMTLAHNTLRDKLAHGARALTGRLTGRGQRPARGKPTDFWALRDVSFEVERGEVLGIIGANGAGKSTILKILSGITAPTEGEVRLRGRVGCLLEVGTGMHPELSGRENVYLNGAILGMRKREIDAKYAQIVAFAGISEFMSTPIKRFSSGMRVRLGFAIAAHLEPEILIVDEVLAVGDLSFQKKCLGRMGEVAGSGRTVLFVSHNMATVANLCTRVLVLGEGHVLHIGDPAESIAFYRARSTPPRTQPELLRTCRNRSGTGQLRLTSFRVESPDGAPLSRARSGAGVVFAFGYASASTERLRNVDVGFSIHRADGTLLSVLYSSFSNVDWNELPSRGTARCVLQDLPLAPGRYEVGARVLVNGIEADWPRDPVGYLDVVEGDFYGTGRSGAGRDAPLRIRGTWRVSPVAQEGNGPAEPDTCHSA